MIANKNMLELCKEIHAGNAEKGFWDDTRTLTECVLLAVGELYEALEAHRKGRYYQQKDGFPPLIELDTVQFEEYAKDTVGDELADFCIRVFDFVDVWKGIMPEQFHRQTLQDVVDISSDIPCKGLLHTIRCENKRMLEVLEPRSNLMISSCIHCAITGVLSYCIEEGIDIIAHIEAKLLYNATRPYKHGKKY